MKELKNLLPVIVVSVCVISALAGYIPPVFSVDAEQESSSGDELPVENGTDEGESETEIETENQVTAPSVLPIAEKALYRDGTYYGSGKGFAGEITVCVVIQTGKISSISVTKTTDGDSFIKKASGIIQSIIASQSTNVDVVSGATYSSVGIIEAVRNALKQAVVDVEGTDYLNQTLPYTYGKEDNSKEKTTSQKSNSETKDLVYRDGIYYGTGEGFAGIIKVKVTIKNGKINDIKILETSDGKEYMESASALLKQIIKKQTYNVDTVSGATYSSTGIIQAVKDALKDAIINEETSDAQSTVANSETTDNSTEDRETTNEGRFPYKAGVYFGTGEGYRDEITAAVVIEEKAIKYILITEAYDDNAFLTKAKAVINNIISKQSTNVDVVSGATYSSKGIIEAVKNALAEAKRITNNITDETQKSTETTTDNNTETTRPQETFERKYKDGTYTAEVLCNPDADRDFEPYTLSVTVVIKNDAIISIENVKGVGKGYDSYNDWYIKRAAEGTLKYKGVVKGILEKGDTSKIDAVSGATCSSNAIINAVGQALEKAEIGQ